MATAIANEATSRALPTRPSMQRTSPGAGPAFLEVTKTANKAPVSTNAIQPRPRASPRTRLPGNRKSQRRKLSKSVIAKIQFTRGRRTDGDTCHPVPPVGVGPPGKPAASRQTPAIARPANQEVLRVQVTRAVTVRYSHATAIPTTGSSALYLTMNVRADPAPAAKAPGAATFRPHLKAHTLRSRM